MTFAKPFASTLTATSNLEAGLTDLAANLVGRLVTPADTDYDELRAIPNLGYDRRPAAIVRVEATRDISEAVNFARTYGIGLGVRGGGHSIAGFSAVEGGIIVDMRTFKGVIIDPIARVGRVQGGATTADIMIPAHEVGLALSTGDTKTVGVGGLTNGGGIGWMVRKHGLAIDNLLKATVVLADGSVVTASPTENSDLFWGIRGGSGNLGIVAEFEFQLAAVREIYGGGLVLPATAEVLRGIVDQISDAPEDLTVIAFVMQGPPAPFIPESWLGRPVAMLGICWTGEQAEGERIVGRLRDLAEPIADLTGVMPYPALYQLTEPAEVPHLNVVRQFFSDELSDEALEAVVEAIANATGPMSMVQIRNYGGAVARVPGDETAFANRDAKLFVSQLALWLDPTDDVEKHRDWATRLYNAMRPAETKGAYSNFVAADEQRISEIWPGETYDRLVALKRRYDPTNLFRFNQNIKP